MTTHEKALRALAQAYDREDAAQRGEPDPWNLDDPGDIGDSDTWVSERLACAQVAAEAFLSALLPEDVAGLVERLRQYEGRQWETTACYNGTRDEATSLIQSQAARIAELEALVGAFVRANDEGPGLIDCIDNHGERYTSAGLDSAIRAARSLLNGERKG